MPTTHHTFCRICEAFCGLEADVEDGQITAIRPDKAHVASKGFACVKGLKQDRIFASPDRLKQPMMRVDGKLVEVSWDTALADIGAKVRQLRAQHGPDNIGMFVGGMAHLTGTDVEVSRAPAPRETASWSGLTAQV